MKLHSLVPIQRDRQEREQRDIAARSVFRHLEQRWVVAMRGRKIPKRQRQKMRNDPAFEQLVDKVLRGEGLPNIDYEQRPHIEKLLDGSVVNAMADELCGDPEDWFCPECGDPVEVPGVCDECVNFRKELH